jgi:predicted ATPase
VRAFRTGLAELAAAGTVILHIDDVHWCDADGVGLLDEILEPPAPPVLLVLIHRDQEPTDPLRALLRAPFHARAHGVDVRMGGLAPADVVAIVQDLAGREHGLDANVIARESEGSPYFATEITRHAIERRNAAGASVPGPRAGTLTLGSTILSRFRNLPEPALRVLAALCVCDGPMPLPLLEAAAGVDDVRRAVAVLRAGSFVRTRRLREVEDAEPYHDRVREEIRRALSESERRALHLRFAVAFEALVPDASEQMLLHFEGAGEFAKASVYASRSAERAAQAQAFEHAAALYRRALDLGTWHRDDERRLHESARGLTKCTRVWNPS